MASVIKINGLNFIEGVIKKMNSFFNVNQEYNFIFLC